jgi:hypothetical protein
LDEKTRQMAGFLFSASKQAKNLVALRDAITFLTVIPAQAGIQSKYASEGHEIYLY